MYILAYPASPDQIIYLDAYGNQYIAKGGSLPWRINNPGLVQSHSHVARKNGSIGACGPYAIFATPEQGHQALSSWLHLKKYSNSTVKAIAKHYQPYDYEGFVQKLDALTALPVHKKIKSFSSYDFACLKRALEKLCKYVALGNEEQFLLPKIIGKIEHGKGKEDSYLISGDIILSKSEVIEWINARRLDASIVHETNGNIHIRSRPGHSFWHLRGSPLTGNPILDTPIATLVRTVGSHRPGQCIWGFINGIGNTKADALHSIEIISAAAGGETVLSLPNDTSWWWIDLLVCIPLKCAIDTFTVTLAVSFFRYLLSLSRQDQVPAVIFVHSQGAIICKHALELLSPSERSELRIFTFGGGSFIAPGKSHADSHNYASAADFVCRLGSPHLQILALESYSAHKKGKSREELIQDLAMRDALLHIDSLDSSIIQKYANERIHYYEQEFEKLSNVTVLDSDFGCNWQHGFENKCYQNVVQSIIKKYQSGRS